MLWTLLVPIINQIFPSLCESCKSYKILYINLKKCKTRKNKAKKSLPPAKGGTKTNQIVMMKVLLHYEFFMPFFYSDIVRTNLSLAIAILAQCLQLHS